MANDFKRRYEEDYDNETAICIGCGRDIEPDEAHNEIERGTLCESCQQNSDEFDESNLEINYPYDSFADAEALASAGFGSDEDYGWCGELEY